MKTQIKSLLFFVSFAVFTALIQIVDVKPIGVNNTNVGFAALNGWFHSLTDVDMSLYNVTDWLGLVPIFVCLLFGAFGFVQLVKRKSLLKVDSDIVILGVYYVLVVVLYLVFEMIPVNYRPVLIDGFAEASYPSSTTLLVLSVMPTLCFQVKRRVNSRAVKTVTAVFTVLFSAFMVVGRLVCGVHWLTDIIGSILLSAGLFCAYKSVTEG